jgi:hypothetical protein
VIPPDPVLKWEGRGEGIREGRGREGLRKRGEGGKGGERRSWVGLGREE